MRLAAFQPDIPQNLGGMIRIGACLGIPIDVIEPCGFPFSVKSLRRSAMDYADLAEICHHADWNSFLGTIGKSRLILLTTKSPQNLWNFNFEPSDILVMGRESAGAPDYVHDRADAAVTLPMPGGGRSMNVTVCAGIAISEAARQVGLWTSCP